FDAFTTGF
uniref:Orcomyotropin n=1 Tax=Faxonius limosus TaxID=28379 RepID=ORMY_FAXLI|nr:RecName: Full=Orcomyotropin; Short=OMT [Faxonius limosus]